MLNNPIVRALITVFKWFPVVFISAVVIWSYYAFVVQLCVLEIKSECEKAMYLIFYHFFFVMFAWSYYQCLFTNAARIPDRFHLPPEQVAQIDSALSIRNYDSAKTLLESFGRNLPVYTRGFNGDIRYCEKCKAIKPDRAHHCSVCERCIVKMDHHWINNCVCFNNYKFFILFLAYAMLYCLYISLTDLQYFIKFWKDQLTEGSAKFHILFLFFISTMFMISLCTLFSYHIYLTLTNRTTIESYRPPVFSGGPDKNGWSLGGWANFTEIFGDRKLLWFLPIFSGKGDGSGYPSNSARNTLPVTADPQTDIEALSSPSLKSNGHGHSFPIRVAEEDRDDLLRRSQWSEEGAGDENPVVNFSYASSSLRIENERRPHNSLF
ncbi:Palmitoyltransferase ZDHHC2 [Hypsibius exemplaris]|uniref:Palmitoyltransferase n=1 Tax=Hypsibius exemplaris TaxID=2072580 RepID=A0A1W0WDE6_HYPEX|nr:Palmitoyltransferase ZDHHC2 [Hypsibius exemplaris]